MLNLPIDGRRAWSIYNLGDPALRRVAPGFADSGFGAITIALSKEEIEDVQAYLSGKIPEPKGARDD